MSRFGTFKVDGKTGRVVQITEWKKYEPKDPPRCKCGATYPGARTAGGDVRHGAHRCARVVLRAPEIQAEPKSEPEPESVPEPVLHTGLYL